MADDNKKSITIDDLAVIVAKGFKNTATKEEINGLTGRMDKLDHQMQALNSNVNNYLELSEKRYVELKHNDAILAKWIKLVADKTGVPIDVSQLEKI